MTWPTGAVETRTHESNANVAGVGGTVIDADDSNWAYDLLERIQIKVGPDTDTSAATSVEGRLKALEGVSPLTNPMSDTGDLIYSSDSAGTAAALGIGTTGQVLTVVAGLPAWADAAAGTFTSPMTTLGDLIYGSTAGAGARLGIGSAGQFLGVSGGLPAWTTPSYVPAPGGPQQGDVLYYNGSTWTRLGPGTTGQFLKTLGPSSNPLWATPPSAAPGDGIPAPAGQAQGDVLIYNGTDWVSLAAGTSGQFLKTNGAAANPSWATPTTGLTNPMTTLSDIIIADTGGTPIRLPIGTNGQLLKVVSGAPAWSGNPLTTAEDIVVGDTPSGGVAPFKRLAKGTNGQVLTVTAGVVGWANNAAGFADPTTTAGDLIFKNATPTTTRLPIGTAGQVLTVVGGLPAWAAAGGGGSGDILNGGNATGANVVLGTTDAHDLLLRAGTGTNAQATAIAIEHVNRYVGLGINNTAPLATVDLWPGLAAFQYSSGGFRHFITTVHQSSGAGGNQFKFYTNTAGSAGTSTAPGTGNQLSLVLDGINGGSIALGGAALSLPINLASGVGGKINFYDGSNYGMGIQSNTVQLFYNSTGDRFAIGHGSSGSFTEDFRFQGDGNAGFGGSSYGGGVKVIFIANAGTNPSTNPSGGGVLYVTGGALTYRGSSGTVTTLGVA